MTARDDARATDVNQSGSLVFDDAPLPSHDLIGEDRVQVSISDKFMLVIASAAGAGMVTFFTATLLNVMAIKAIAVAIFVFVAVAAFAWFTLAYALRQNNFAEPTTARKATLAEVDALKQSMRELKYRLAKAELHAQSADRIKKAFMGQINHNMRTPLNHIIGFSDVMLHETYGKIGDDRYLRYLEDIKKSGEHMLFEFSQILELAQVTTGTSELKVQTISSADLRQHIKNHHEKRAKNAGLSLMIDLPDDIEFESDKNCVLRIVDGLISNAIKFTGRNGRVVVDLISDAGFFVLKVTDDGIGISDRQLAHLNTPFAFEDYEHASKTRGRGMGIPMAHALAELCGGELQIDSTPGIGTCAAVMLPLSPYKDGLRTFDHPDANTWLAA